jgi:hypothetical protein
MCEPFEGKDNAHLGTGLGQGGFKIGIESRYPDYSRPQRHSLLVLILASACIESGPEWLFC